MSESTTERTWTFLTNHAHVLLAISTTPDLRLRDIADLVDVTERTAMQIVADLEQAGYILRIKEGRRNRYVVQTDHPLRHPLEAHHPIATLIEALAHQDPRTTAGRLGPDDAIGAVASSS